MCHNYDTFRTTDILSLIKIWRIIPALVAIHSIIFQISMSKNYIS